MPFTPKQVEQLLRPIHPSRVLELRGHSHVSEQDVQAHLIRMFGFGGYDTEVLQVECLYAVPTIITPKGASKPDPNRWDVCYRVLMRLTVKDADGNVVQRIEDGSTGVAQNQTRADGHDLAYKSAISLSMKRCAKGLGDQFGLSLYNKGQRAALVIDTLVGREPSGDAEAEDVQASVPQQVADGSDANEPPPDEEPHHEPEPQRKAPAQESSPAIEGGGGITEHQMRHMMAAFNSTGHGTKDDQVDTIKTILGLDELASRKNLTEEQAEKVLDGLRAEYRTQKKLARAGS